MELVSQGLDPSKHAQGCLETARVLLKQVEEKSAESDVRQAAEKLWSAAALAVKVYAAWRKGKSLTSHGELWRYSLVLRVSSKP